MDHGSMLKSERVAQDVGVTIGEVGGGVGVAMGLWGDGGRLQRHGHGHGRQRRRD